MFHLSNILAQGYKEWTPGQWGLAATLVLGALGTFLLATFGPWLLKMSKEIREMRQQVSDNKTQATVAEIKADAANQSIKNTNDRVVHVASLSTPPSQTPAAERSPFIPDIKP